jgi:signal transduction histidine kinase
MGREQGVNMVNFIREKAKEKLPLFVNIAAIDFQRIVTNVIENARRHGFTDKARDDYYIGIELSYNSERGMYQIDFTNNGNPLPDGMTKSRFGIRGEKAGLTAGTGSGGYIVKSIVNHYGGDYDIFCKDGNTTVRILLPIATI